VNAGAGVSQNTADKRIHVVGCPRSGTTLMTELLRHAYSFNGKPLHEQSLFEPLADVSCPYLSKKPSDTHRISKLFKADEDLYVIALVRDPRSVVTSQHWSSAPGEYYVGFARWRRAMEAIAKLTPRHRCIQVHYEALLTDPAAVQRLLEERIPFLRREKSFESFASEAADVPGNSVSALNGVRDFDLDRIEAWQDHTPRVSQQLVENPDLVQWLIETGYETDAGWTGLLARVVPAGISAKPLRTGLLKSCEEHLRYWWKTRRYLKSRQRT